ncbi:FkbM family methyltransferase [Candidatus Chloroploca sp. Khr17]|uniref:FkbM family methyltransferase n=1 Tax=Candidatus Chloroploca sp. Khr17 TaxID=2496869 RepID=UPI00101C3BF6|nr:FkbM family methyltransferase [Candidatus Chloroploca sp. Khr17]
MAWKTHLRRWVRSLGWDIVRYRPLWPTLLGVERLPIRTVLDIGAYDGDTARVFRRFFPQAHIYCFEPQPEPVQALTAWAATQQDLVHVLPFALDSTSGTANLHRNPQLPRMASLAAARPGHPNRLPDAITLSIPIMRLDEAVSAHIPLVDDLLIKIDVEGHERAILAGGPITLQRCRACIMEFHTQHAFDGQMSLMEVIAALGDYGLEYGGVLQQTLRQGRVQYFDTIFVNWTHGSALRPR